MRAGVIDATPVVGDGGTVPSVEHSRSAVSCLAVQVGISPEANQILVPASYMMTNLDHVMLTFIFYFANMLTFKFADMIEVGHIILFDFVCCTNSLEEPLHLFFKENNYCIHFLRKRNA